MDWPENEKELLKIKNMMIKIQWKRWKENIKETSQELIPKIKEIDKKIEYPFGTPSIQLIGIPESKKNKLENVSMMGGASYQIYNFLKKEQCLYCSKDKLLIFCIQSSNQVER